MGQITVHGPVSAELSVAGPVVPLSLDDGDESLIEDDLLDGLLLLLVDWLAPLPLIADSAGFPTHPASSTAPLQSSSLPLLHTSATGVTWPSQTALHFASMHGCFPALHGPTPAVIGGPE
jgi:hypothetical protein